MLTLYKYTVNGYLNLATVVFRTVSSVESWYCSLQATIIAHHVKVLAEETTD